LNGCLLDANVALLNLARPEKISAAARAAIEQGPNVLSAISYWEVVLKYADPFDRIVVAQTLEEDLDLVSVDAELGGYAGAGLRVFW
jgi:PIN domain nuclease of toxin-antitoxin system